MSSSRTEGARIRIRVSRIVILSQQIHLPAQSISTSTLSSISSTTVALGIRLLGPQMQCWLLMKTGRQRPRANPAAYIMLVLCAETSRITSNPRPEKLTWNGGNVTINRF